MLRLFLPFFLLVFSAHADDNHPRPFSDEADARAEVNAALARAAVNNIRTLIVFGANWCHDSRGLANHFAQEDMQTLLTENYELVWVDVGWRHRHLPLLRDMGAYTIYGTPTVLIIDPDIGLVNRDTMHTWHTAYSRDHADVVRYFQRMAFTRPAGGVVENSRTYARLVDQINEWEAREGARLSLAYLEMQNWREAMDEHYDRAGQDDESTRLVTEFQTVEAAIDAQRNRMRQDRSNLYTQARETVRDALFELGSNLTPELAEQLDASAPEIELDYPDYSARTWPWEEEGWAF
ncbi:thioredoxin family protein [Hyphobacterium sp.]|uniref:thioredoxin family protein n=1 Tax=Hyphobacterium sp. TaxID=2004662 RepID=UPI003BAD550A